jgi:hypothetical protein
MQCLSLKCVQIRNIIKVKPFLVLISVEEKKVADLNMDSYVP